MMGKKFSEKLSKSNFINKISNSLKADKSSNDSNQTTTDDRTLKHSEGILSYKAQGEGSAILLMHGFLEDSSVWGSFADKLSAHFKVINLDLPGHGKSELLSETAGPRLMAKAANAVLEAEEIEQAIIMGHSMGGYAACAFAALYPERLKALILFHSVPYADTADKKNARNAAIQRINDGDKEALCREHTPRVFAEKNLKKFSKILESNTQTALSIKADTIKATLRGMRDREDYVLTIKELKQPLLYIEGAEDDFIPAGSLKEEHRPDKCQIVHLEKSGHIGFVEEEQNALQSIIEFGQKVENNQI